MLLWAPSSPPGSFDEDEKAAKQHREKVARFRKFLVVLAGLSIVVIITLAAIEPNQRQNVRRKVTSTVRRHMTARGRHQQQLEQNLETSTEVQAQEVTYDREEVREKQADQPVEGTLELPRESIYRLAVPGAKGETVSLESFSGMVTLVVNTACM